MSTFSVSSQGVITVDTSEIRADFEDAYRGALGADLNTRSGTFQGNMIINDTATLIGAMGEVVNVANSFSPYYATGHALDVSGAFFGYYRKSAQSTVVVAKLTGVAGTLIPTGSILSDGKNEYVSLDTVVISQSGTTNAQFACTIPGPITCPANTLNTIITQITGWETANNPYDGVIGYDQESDNSFSARITANWMNKRARSILGAIIDNVAALPGVISVVGKENPTKTQTTIDDVVMEPNSIYLAILGGDGSDIARVIAQQKTLGAATVGNTQITYTDSNSANATTYNIMRPTVIELGVQIQYGANPYTGADIAPQIRKIVMEYVQNNPFKIGQVVSGNVLAQSLTGFNQIDLLSFKVRAGSSGEYTDYIDTTISQVASLSEANIDIQEVK